MSDDMNDFDSDDFNLDGFDDLEKNDKNTLGDLWRNNVFVKIGAILLGVIVLIGVSTLFGGSKDNVDEFSSATTVSDLTEVPGGSEEVSENITRAIEDENMRRLETALRENESAIPIPTNATKDRITLEDFSQEKEEDPLERWRSLQESKAKRAVEAHAAQAEATPEVDTRTPIVDALSASMAEQMQSILTNQTIDGVKTTKITDVSYLESMQQKIEDKKKEKEEARRAAGGNSGDSLDGGDGEILLPAGTIEYAQLIIEANTDVPGPVLAELMSGPFKGARLIGSFEETYDYLTLNFNTIVLDGVDYSISAVALDPNTTLPGVVTDINRRYFTRVVLPVAAEFITGLASAISQSGVTSVRVSGDSTTETVTNSSDNDQEVASGIATAGAQLSEIIQEHRDNRPQLLRIRAGTPLGIFFVEAITNEEDGEEVVGPYEQLQTLQILNNKDQ